MTKEEKALWDKMKEYQKDAWAMGLLANGTPPSFDAEGYPQKGGETLDLYASEKKIKNRATAVPKMKK